MITMNSKKLDDLCCWEHIGAVNEKLDSGESPNRVHGWIKTNGFKISLPMVYEYARHRKLSLVNSILTKRGQSVKRIPIIKSGTVAVKRLKNELDALEAIIQLGYQTLCELPSSTVTPKLMMEAIALKNKITEGSYGNMTEFGLYQLREMEAQKINRILHILKKYVPQDKFEEAIEEIEAFEDDFYYQTEYYADYLSAKA